MRLAKPIIKRIKSGSVLSFLSKQLLYGLTRLLFLTYRLEVKYPPTAEKISPSRLGVFYFWHQQIIAGMFFFFKTKSTGSCVVSPSDDGKMAGFVCKKLGFDVLYGSSHKSCISVVRQSLGALQKTGRLCLVGDGSRGPAFKLQKGVSYLAEKANVPLVFIECKPQWAITFSRSWDQFQIPLPFSKIQVTIHEPSPLNDCAG